MVHLRAAHFRRLAVSREESLADQEAGVPSREELREPERGPALSELPFTSAALIALHDLAGAPFRDLAWIFDLASADAARMRRNRALEYLRGEVRAPLTDPRDR
jgi:hypothetical protein